MLYHEIPSRNCKLVAILYPSVQHCARCMHNHLLAHRWWSPDRGLDMHASPGRNTVW